MKYKVKDRVKCIPFNRKVYTVVDVVYGDNIRYVLRDDDTGMIYEGLYEDDLLPVYPQKR